MLLVCKVIMRMKKMYKAFIYDMESFGYTYNTSYKFNIDSNTTIIFILSMLTSTPTNAVIIKDMLDNKIIDEKTANKIIPYTYFSSISYVLGTIGIGIFNSYKTGLLIWSIILLNNVLIGIIQRKEKNTIIIPYNKNKDNSILNVIKNSILKGFNTSFIILGNLIIFTIITNIFIKYVTLNPIILTIISGTLELTNGINMISILDISFQYKMMLTIFLLSFGSLSILFQSFSILSGYNINIKRILFIKFIFSLIIIIILLFFQL